MEKKANRGKLGAAQSNYLGDAQSKSLENFNLTDKDFENMQKAKSEMRRMDGPDIPEIKNDLSTENVSVPDVPPTLCEGLD